MFRLRVYACFDPRQFNSTVENNYQKEILSIVRWCVAVKLLLLPLLLLLPPAAAVALHAADAAAPPHPHPIAIIDMLLLLKSAYVHSLRIYIYTY